MTKIKLCGLFREPDVAAANRCMPDYAGFVFAPSKRMVTQEQAKRFRALLHPGIQAVGVFVNQDVGLIAKLCREGVIQCVQLHGEEDAAYIRALRGRVDAPVIRSVPVAHSLPELPQDADYLLFDKASAARGGTGSAFDWTVLRDYTGTPYFLAGGLGCDNVAQALSQLAPHCVDVSSGIETDGVKDPDKMLRFVGIVRGSR